jgi:serine/threonine protein kinase
MINNDDDDDCVVAVGMAHLHSKKIVHRDLKSLNILLQHPLIQDGAVNLKNVMKITGIPSEIS